MEPPQLEKFRSLKGIDDGPLVDNFRPLQDLQDRIVEYWA
jgi:hypothetical protein